MGAHSRSLSGVIFVFGGPSQREIRTYEGFSDYHIKVWTPGGVPLPAKEVAEGIRKFEQVAKRWRKKKFIITTASWGMRMPELARLLEGLPENCQLPQEVLHFRRDQREPS